MLNEFQWWHEVAVGTNQNNGICGIEHAIGHHSDGNIHIGFLLLWSRNGVMAVGTLYLFLKVLTANHLETFSIQEFIGVEKGTLPTALLWIERRSCEIDHLFQMLPITEESFAQFYHINPIIVTPMWFIAFCATQAIVKVETVDVKCYSLCHMTVIKNKKPPSDGHIHSRKNGGALIIRCKVSLFF